MERLTTRLVDELRSGNHDSFAELVELYKDGVFAVAYKILYDRGEAEDAAQETFIRAYTRIDTYDSQYKFKTWIYRIATNVAIDRLRKRKPEYSMDAEIAGTDGLTYQDHLADEAPQPDAQVVHREIRGEMHEAIKQLPDKYRIPLLLKYVDDLSLKEISVMIDMPVATVKTRIFRGREMLKTIFQNREGFN